MSLLARAFEDGLVRCRSLADLAEGHSTRAKLMSAAEHLFGEHGLDTVSLHALAAEAGQANKYAVQYHFGDRDGLVNEVFKTRFKYIEERRSFYLDVAREHKLEIDLKTIATITMLPFAEQVDEEGNLSFAKFLLQYFIQFSPWDGIPFPVRNEPNISTQLFYMIVDALPEIQQQQLSKRTLLLAHLPLIALIEAENVARSKKKKLSVEATLRDVVSMWAAAVSVNSV